MNRRKFFTALAAVFAAPKLLSAARARWIVPPHRINPAWITATHEIRFPVLNRYGQKYIVPIIYKRPVSPGLRIDAEDVFKGLNERV